jgi:hypothetical protein
VERVWVQNDGGLSDGSRVRYPLPGRSALSDAAVVYGLSNPREFPILELVRRMRMPPGCGRTWLPADLSLGAEGV